MQINSIAIDIYKYIPYNYDKGSKKKKQKQQKLNRRHVRLKGAKRKQKQWMEKVDRLDTYYIEVRDKSVSSKAGNISDL